MWAPAADRAARQNRRRGARVQHLQINHAPVVCLLCVVHYNAIEFAEDKLVEGRAVGSSFWGKKIGGIKTEFPDLGQFRTIETLNL